MRISSGRVDHVEQQVSETNRIERRAERLDELMRELRDETNGVGQEHCLSTGQGQLAGPRVQGLEEAVGSWHVGVGQLVEQRGLAGIGVADQRHLPTPPTATLCPLGRSVLVHLPQISLEPVHPPHQPPPIDLELGLTRSPRPDATRLLRQAMAASAQPGKAIAKQRELDLCPAFWAPCVLGEDVEDHRSAIDGGATEDLLEVPLLRRAQIVIEHHRVDIVDEAELVELLGLSRAEERRRVRVILSLDDPVDDVRACRRHERGELIERGLEAISRAAR